MDRTRGLMSLALSMTALAQSLEREIAGKEADRMACEADLRSMAEAVDRAMLSCPMLGGDYLKKIKAAADRGHRLASELERVRERLRGVRLRLEGIEKLRSLQAQDTMRRRESDELETASAAFIASATNKGQMFE